MWHRSIDPAVHGISNIDSSGMGWFANVWISSMPGYSFVQNTNPNTFMMSWYVVIRKMVVFQLRTGKMSIGRNLENQKKSLSLLTLSRWKVLANKKFTLRTITPINHFWLLCSSGYGSTNRFKLKVFDIYGWFLWMIFTSLTAFPADEGRHGCRWIIQA